MSNYNKRWRTMLKYLKKNNADVAKETGLEYQSVRKYTGTRDSKFSNWGKWSLFVFETLMKEIKRLSVLSTNDPWIQCVDELPIAGQEVLYCTPSDVKECDDLVVCYGEYGNDNRDGFVDYTQWNDIYGYETEDKVICWQPMIKPYGIINEMKKK